MGGLGIDECNYIVSGTVAMLAQAIFICKRHTATGERSIFFFNVWPSLGCVRVDDIPSQKTSSNGLRVILTLKSFLNKKPQCKPKNFSKR